MKPLDSLNSANFYGVQTLTLDNKIIAFSTTNNVSGVGLNESPFFNVSLQISSIYTSSF